MTTTSGHEILMLELDDPRWLDLLAGAEATTPFHHPSWAQLLSRTYGYPAFAVASAQPDGRLLAGLPMLEVRTLARRRKWISLPFTDECPPLVRSGPDPETLSMELAEALESLGSPVTEVRAAVAGLRWHTHADALIHELDLDPDPERVRENFSRSRVIRNIARAERDGTTVRRARTAADLEQFYALHVRTRRRQGVPVQPRRFFELLWSEILEHDGGFILLADAGGRAAVAGALFLSRGATTIYKFGASDVEAWPYRPNHLIMWRAIQEACARGHCRFDFGRTDLDNEGLRAFKLGWGTRERPLTYSSYIPERSEGEALPSRVLGLAIRRGPAWLCRGAGAALYRYAASR